MAEETIGAYETPHGSIVQLAKDNESGTLILRFIDPTKTEDQRPVVWQWFEEGNGWIAEVLLSRAALEAIHKIVLDLRIEEIKAEIAEIKGSEVQNG